MVPIPFRLEGCAPLGLINASQLAIVNDATGAYFSYRGDPSQYFRILGAAAGSHANADFVFG